MSVDKARLTGGLRIAHAAVVLGPAGLALVLAAVRSGQVPLWRDEFATSMFASLPPADLLAATAHVDGVIAPYYLLMHALSPVLGLGLGMRVVSVLAFAATAAVTAIVAARWWGPLGGATAGLAVVFNGDALSSAVNARPYALSLLLVALAVLLLDVAVRTGRRSAWIGYAAASATAIALQLFAVLAVGTLAVLILGRSGSTWKRWALASLPALGAAVVLVVVGLHHRGQLVWLGTPDVREAVLGLARSSGVSADRGAALDAVALGALVSMGTLAIVAVGRARDGSGAPDAVRTRAFSFALMLAPPMLLFILSQLITPVFTGKYFIWSSLGAALLLGSALALLARPRRWTGTVAGVVAAVLLMLSATVAGSRLLDPPPRGDDFPAAVRELESSAAVGDGLVVAQPYAFGGVAHGFAVSAGDEDHVAEIAERAVSGTQPVLDMRTITDVTPLRTVAAAPRVAASHATWVLTIFPLTRAQLATVDPAMSACLETIDFEAPTERYGALRLFRLECAAAVAQPSP